MSRNRNSFFENSVSTLLSEEQHTHEESLLVVLVRIPGNASSSHFTMFSSCGRQLLVAVYPLSSHNAAATPNCGAEPCLRVVIFRRGGWSNKLHTPLSIWEEEGHQIIDIKQPWPGPKHGAGGVQGARCAVMIIAENGSEKLQPTCPRNAYVLLILEWSVRHQHIDEKRNISILVVLLSPRAPLASHLSSHNFTYAVVGLKPVLKRDAELSLFLNDAAEKQAWVFVDSSTIALYFT